MKNNRLNIELGDLVGEPPPPPPRDAVTQHASDAAPAHDRDAVTQHDRDAPPPKPKNRAGSRRHPYPTKGQLYTRVTITMRTDVAELYESVTRSMLPPRYDGKKNLWAQELLRKGSEALIESARARRGGRSEP